MNGLRQIIQANKEAAKQESPTAAYNRRVREYDEQEQWESLRKPGETAEEQAARDKRK